jgi:hypothetical protein
MRRLVLSLLTCLALLRPDAAVAAACHQSASDSGACCTAACGCCEKAGETTACCCEEDESPTSTPERAPAPASSSTDLERALCLATPALAWTDPFNAHELRASKAPRREGLVVSGRSLLRQGCRLRH